MTMFRTTRKNMTFAHPFVLRGMDAERPAGTYVVEVDEELMTSLSFIAYKRTETRIRLPAIGGMDVEIVRVDPIELEEAARADRWAGLLP